MTKVVDIILEDGPNRGLVLSTSYQTPNPKSLIWSYDTTQLDDDPLQRGIPTLREEGTVTLGCPIRSVEFIRNYIEEKILKVQKLMDKLHTLNDAQTEYVLLRSCLQLPKIIYLLRTINSDPYLEQWSQFDHVTRDTLSCIIASDVTDKIWCESKLPLTMGGLRLRSAVDHAPAAYVSSYNHTFVTMPDILQIPDLP